MDTKYSYNGVVRPRFTPSNLCKLKPDEVFVFGSNIQGHHKGGASRVAMNHFGAKWGKGVGLQGQSYAIPTTQEDADVIELYVDESMDFAVSTPSGVDTIVLYVDDFIRFAREHKELFFYVTRIGCGNAGFTDEDIAPLFAEAQYMGNICLPESFVEVIKPALPKELRQMMYGQMRTFVDLLKVLNRDKPIVDVDEAMRGIRSILERNVSGGDDVAFMAFRTIWCIMSKNKGKGLPVDLDKLEKAMYDFHKGRGCLVEKTVEMVMYKYSVTKMFKYIRLLNDFRRYKSYDEIKEDLESIPVDHCGSNDPDYYFSFGRIPLIVLQNILYNEWKNISPNGRLDTDRLEEILMGRFQKALAKYGIGELIRRSYGDVGCHPSIQGPNFNSDEPVYGPFFYVGGGQIEKGCSDFRKYPYSSQEFEMGFVSGLLEKDPNYIHIKEDNGDEYYLPCQDFTLPVYSRIDGKLHFDTDDEKLEFIVEHRFPNAF